MRGIGREGRRWLRGLHLICGAAWLGGILGLLVVSLAGGAHAEAGALVAIRRSLHALDLAVIIPACLSALLTGALLSWLTPWGFFQHRWLLVKWIATVSMVLFGAFFLGPWVESTATIAADRGAGALSDPTFSLRHALIIAFAIGQALLLVALIFVSVLKPWGRSSRPT